MVGDRPDKPQPRQTYVYFARTNPSGLIKIGYSGNPDLRAGTLKYEIGEPLQILFTIPGGRVQENGFHKRFAAYRSHGEWFHEAGKLHDFLKAKGHAGTRVVIEKQTVQQPGATRIIEVLKPYFVDKMALSNGPRPTLIGYARVSTEDQNLDVQIAALRDAGVTDENLFVEKLSAMNSKRPLFHVALKSLERGDTLVVHSLSRLGRDVRQIHEILGDLDKQGIAWRSITEPQMNNATAVGRLMLNVTGAMAQFERDQIKERTKRGMDELKRQGKTLGRKKLFDAKQTKQIKQDRKTMTREEVAAKWECSPGTIDKYAA